MNRLSYYVRARLQRRLFLWFGVAILLSGVAFSIVMLLVSAPGGPAWAREVGRARVFLGARFGEVWNDDRARDALARAIAQDLDVTVILREPNGSELQAFGHGCGRKAWTLEAPAVREGHRLGIVTICAERTRTAGPLRWLAPLVAASVILWALSGTVARRLSRPLEELARVAGEIGRGNYGARARMGRHVHGEAVVLSMAMNEMAARIERQMSDQRELLAAVSHELRTPLARIRLLTELTRDGVNVQKNLDELDREVFEIDALVGDLLAQSRLDFTALAKEQLDPVETGLRALDRAGVGAEALVVEGKPESILADPTLFARALANLLDNAKKHGGGVVALRITALPGVVAFEVEDAGRGLEPGEERRIFEPFYRRPDEKAREQGSLGLGLALVSRIAEAHGGRARAANREEGGARIGLEVPIAPRQTA
ncbi:HAMP domain-containing sensor histidine kinase [Polyangium sp. y55x31]|uniref:HAMP domain-containing sensor histidine kinase n=1 Tax=Polyangium sp. y55x31 TaxID=3042688 RepID=UPI002482A276|nr:HAMP domain-containing sensor histidine kinase [Polyangium sp. y55x31]MDI1484440.1 HAMP domain-containing sensor histidine kinase [Polyangium sp. y55x31]